MAHDWRAFPLQVAIPPHLTGEIPHEPISGAITRHRDPLEHHDFQFSRCTGRKKAVCVSLLFKRPMYLFLRSYYVRLESITPVKTAN